MTQGSLGEAVLDLAADSAGLLNDINKARPEALSAMQSLGVAGGALLAAGITLAAAAVVGITMLVWDAGMKMDAAYDTLAIKTGKTGAELKTIQGDFDAVFSSIPTDATTAADAIGILNSRLDVSGPILQDLSKNVLEFSRLTKTDASQNADTFAQIISKWEIPIEDASTSLDALFVASQKTGAPVGELMQSVLDSGPVLKQYGFSFDEAAAFLSKTNQAGIDTTGMMMGLKSAAAKYAAEGKPLNQGLADTLKYIKDAKDPTQALNAAVEIFGGRAGPAMVDAIRSGKMEFADLVPMLQDADGAILKTAKETADWGEIWQTFQNKMTTVLGPAGRELMDGVADALNMVAEVVMRPDIQNGLMMVVGVIVQLAQTAAAYLPVVISNIFMLIDFLQTHHGVVVAILAVLGVAFLAFGVSVATAAWAAISPLLPVIAVIALIAAAAYLLYTAWTENWGGIQQIAAAFWAWLQPILLQLWGWLTTNIPLALQALANYWQNVLLPAIMAVWGWMSATLFPFLGALGNFLNAVFSVALRAMAGIWQNVLQPALQSVFDKLSKDLMPLFQALTSWWNTSGQPMAMAIAKWFGENIAKAFSDLSKNLQDATEWLNDIAAQLASLQLPSWMTPGSPTPWEIGLVGVNDALKAVSNIGLPSLQGSMDLMPAPALAGGNIPLSSGGQVSIPYQPFISTADEYEATRVLRPFVEKILREQSNK